tara:strand:+ start:130 stop:300 length:171 start_codon:yes stop_codon:yes gene_type:complete
MKIELTKKELHLIVLALEELYHENVKNATNEVLKIKMKDMINDFKYYRTLANKGKF